MRIEELQLAYEHDAQTVFTFREAPELRFQLSVPRGVGSADYLKECGTFDWVGYYRYYGEVEVLFLEKVNLYPYIHDSRIQDYRSGDVTLGIGVSWSIFISIEDLKFTVADIVLENDNQDVFGSMSPDLQEVL